MIFPNEKEAIIKVLGKQPSRKIQPYLKLKKCLNARGVPYSPRSIQDVINGETDNFDVEKHIFELVAIEKKNIEKLNELKQQIL